MLQSNKFCYSLSHFIKEMHPTQTVGFCSGRAQCWEEKEEKGLKIQIQHCWLEKAKHKCIKLNLEAGTVRKLAALPTHSLVGLHAQFPSVSQHSDLESKLKEKKKMKVCHCYRCRKHNSMSMAFFLLTLQNQYSRSTALASTSTCTGTASNDPALTLAGAHWVLPATDNTYSVLLSCFHAAPQEEAGSAVRGRGAGGAAGVAGVSQDSAQSLTRDP